MTNAKAITILDLVVETAKGICDWAIFIPNKTISEAHKIAVKALEAQEWIPCKKQLPVENDTYFVTFDPDYLPPGYKSTDAIAWQDGKWIMADYFLLDEEGRKKPEYKVVEVKIPILAWKPLPEPYKAESEEV